MNEIMFQAFVYLGAAVIAVPIAKRLGLGSVLGYLIAGIIIGPVIGLVGSETNEIQHFAEFGVVMMLFLVGLELQPKALWEMRNRLIGLGGLQVGLSVLLIAAGALLLGYYWSVALTIGLIFSLSSTAIVLQTLTEKGLNKTEGGRASFSVLLFQDIAVIPMLALIPLLILPEFASVDHLSAVSADHHKSISLVENLPGWAHTLTVLTAIGGILFGGHFLAQPLFRFIASSRLREIFTVSALLIVVGIALLMTLVGLSPALGTFIAGVILANSEFRHELESDIEPFKGLLLGLFFITVGAGINFDILFSDLYRILGLTLCVMLIKGGVLYVLALIFKLKRSNKLLFTLGLAQAGEFGFVLLSFSLSSHVIPPEVASTLSLIVALSMLLTPGLFILYEKLGLSNQNQESESSAEEIKEQANVIIAGAGRFGQIVNRTLIANDIKTTVLDHEASIIDMLDKIGIKTYYGDASRPELLHAAGIESASVFVIALDDKERAIQLVEFIKRHHPQVKTLVRAFDINHLYLLKKAGADYAIREVFESSLEMSKTVLNTLGVHPFKSEKMINRFKKHNEAGLEELYHLWDENTETAKNKAFLAGAKEHSETLQSMIQQDRSDLHDRTERGWTPPPKGYADQFEN